MHLHLLVLDGVYEYTSEGLEFQRVASPSSQQLQTLLDTLCKRIGRYLERLVRDEDSYLQLEDPNGLGSLRSYSIRSHCCGSAPSGFWSFIFRLLNAG